VRAAFWWIDRWRQSSAYMDMSAEERGVYRELIDELWLREGAIPNDEKLFVRLSGSQETWERVKETVLSRFYLTTQGYRNKTHDKVSEESKKRAERQKRYRNKTRNVTVNVAASPSQELRTKEYKRDDNVMRNVTEHTQPVIFEENLPTSGKLIGDIPCPTCKAVTLKRTVARGVHPPGFWCQPNFGGCGENFPLDFPAIYKQLTPGAKSTIDELKPKPKQSVPFRSVADMVEEARRKGTGV
jgi:uncharacterized protein YdaU (DUF1376 family)